MNPKRNLRSNTKASKNNFHSSKNAVVPTSKESPEKSKSSDVNISNTNKPNLPKLQPKTKPKTTQSRLSNVIANNAPNKINSPKSGSPNTPKPQHQVMNNSTKNNSTISDMKSKLNSTANTTADNKLNSKTCAALIQTNNVPKLSLDIQNNLNLSNIPEQGTDKDNVECKQTQTYPCPITQDITVQTDIDNQVWLNMRDGFLDKIMEQEKEITDLKNQISSLETIIQNISSTPVAPTSDPPQGHGTFMGVRETGNTDHKDIISSCFIIGDSHVRGLSDKLSQTIPGSCKVEAFFQPGAGFHEVAQTHVHSPNLISADSLDSIVVMCGTNDVCSATWETIESGLHSLTTRFNQCKQFCLVGIPLRYDSRKLNFHIHRLNTKVRNYVKSNLNSDRFSYIDPAKFLKFKHYAVDKIHLNTVGKEKLSDRIKNSLFKQFSFRTTGAHNAFSNMGRKIVPQPSIVNSDLGNMSLFSPLNSTPATYAQALHNPKSPHLTVNSQPRYGYLGSTPNVSSLCHVKLPDLNSYYRLTQKINMSTLSNESSSFSMPTPIPRIEPGYIQRSQNNLNFTDQGQTSTT